MEIHAPHKPILSLKEAAVHLAIVTVGILIALSFEGIREWREHRALVAEARENIRRELSDNSRELEGFLKRLPTIEDDLAHTRELLPKLANGESLENEQIQLGYSVSSLGTASRTTAEITGAFGYMPYDDVRRYAEVYDLQGKFSRLQDEALSNFAPIFSSGRIFGQKAKVPPEEITEVRRQVDAMLGSLTVQRQLGQALLGAYRKLAAER